ncbi:CCHC-type domain-containing protein [Trichonephila clavipes]|nr:CCHC-type domain-containing protein [Trichonephila clavipes]
MEGAIDLPRAPAGRPSQWQKCQQNLQKLDHDQHTPAVTGKYRAPVQNSHPEPRKTDVWRTADNRPVCFHCGRPGHVMRYCRERKAVFDSSRNRRRNFDDVGTEEKYADQTLSPFYQVPRGRPIPKSSFTDPRRHIADQVDRLAVGARKTKKATLQGGVEAACTGNPPVDRQDDW